MKKKKKKKGGHTSRIKWNLKRKTNEKRVRDGKRSGAADNRRTRRTNTDKDAAHAGTKYPPADNLKRKGREEQSKKKKNGR